MSGRGLIAVDIGNSSTKLGFFRGPLAPPAELSPNDATTLPQPVDTTSFPTGSAPPDDLLARLPRDSVCWSIASVNRAGQKTLGDWLATNRAQDECRILSHEDLPIAVNVEHPEQVGIDRLAAAVAANAIRQPDRTAIVIDAGSAVTIDLVGTSGAFEGGVILAGFRMQARALYETADLLPLADFSPDDEPPPVVGKHTQAAIRSGLFWGAVGAVREIVARMAERLTPEPDVFVTGGDLARLAPLLGGQTRFVPHMVLTGIAISERSRHAPPGKTP